MPILNTIKIQVVGVCGAAFLRLLNLTIRWKNLGKLEDPNFWKTADPSIFAFWHGRQLLMTFTKVDFDRKKPLYVLISQHADGRMISKAINLLGVRSIAGSSSKRGGQAARELLDILDNGGHIAITPDGPKGPVYRSKKGVIFLASQSGKAIYPLTIAAERYWKFKSWDKMILPKPFTRAVRVIGEPLTVPQDLTEEQAAQYQKLLDQRLSTLTEEADSYNYDSAVDSQGRIQKKEETSLFCFLYAAASFFYGLINQLRNLFFDYQIFSSYRSKLPVLCVGNITVGGTGKTPLVQYLIAALRARGETPVVLSRGYGGRHRGPYLVQPSDTAHDIGDEVKMLSQDASLPIVISRSRVLGAQYIEEKKLGSVIIMDDGYQHRWLARNLNLACINIADQNAVSQFLKGSLLPAGIFREQKIPALRRASAIVLSTRRVQSQSDQITDFSLINKSLPQDLPVFTSHLSNLKFYQDGKPVVLDQKEIAIVCGIANPQGFIKTLNDLGYTIRRMKLLPDHSTEVEREVSLILSETTYPVVVTEKDGVKLSVEVRNHQRVFQLTFQLEVEPKQQFEDLIADALTKQKIIA